MASLTQEDSDGSDYGDAEVTDDALGTTETRRQTFAASKNAFMSMGADDDTSDIRKTISIHSLAQHTQDTDVPEIKPEVKKSPKDRSMRRLDSARFLGR